MRIAVIGSGIAGLGAAWLLSRQHEVVLFEKQRRLGGHTHTHHIARWDRDYHIDTGFIVHNRQNYPLLSRFFDELGVATQPTTMGFSVQDASSGLEYNATSLNGIFCQRSNLLSPRFIGMIAQIKRFYRESRALLDIDGSGPTLGQYLREHGYSRMFIDCHLVPMACALWSSPSESILDFPAKYLVRFMDNHDMLQVEGRPQWRVVRGGSARYIKALQARWDVSVRMDAGVRSVRRQELCAVVVSQAGEETFDQVVFACHSDEALALLADPSAEESAILGAIRYQDNDTVLHTDARMLPSCRRAWAAWNAYLPVDAGQVCTVSYCMNLLQSIESPEPFVVSLNRTADIDPAKIIARMPYRHPVYTHSSVAAQALRERINGVRRSWYAGAYWGFGFHEDGLRSGVDVARALGSHW